MTEPPVEITVAPDGKRHRISVRIDGKALAIETISLMSRKQRSDFIKSVTAKAPALDPDELDQLLIEKADATTNKPDTVAVSVPVEMDVTRIVRPEAFTTEEVSGVTVPVCLDIEGKPAPRWMMYLKWADGKRECRTVSECVDLPSNQKLWINPVPGDPAINTASAWSKASRQKWLEGSRPVPNVADLFKRVCERISHYLDLPPETAPGTTATLALWSMMTYGYGNFNAVPYLFVGGALGSGKSTVFAILNQLAFRPLNSSSMTGPSLFRTLHDRGGTLLLDEAERLKAPTPETAELLSMLLAGYKRGGVATRLEAVGDKFKTLSFDVFGPKALACIAGLPPALASRCIPITMFRSSPNSEKPKRRIDGDPAKWQKLRDDLHVWSLESSQMWLDLPKLTEVCPPGLSGRDFELWQPLLSLASWIETCGAAGLLDLAQKHALETRQSSQEEQTPDADETLLEILASKIALGESPTPGEILQAAVEKDKPTFEKWTAKGVSNRLKLYGAVASKVNGSRRYRTVSIADLQRIQRNYGIELGVHPHPETPSLPSLPSLDGKKPLDSERNGQGR